MDRAKGWLNAAMNAAAEAKTAALGFTDDLAFKPGQGPTSVGIHNNTTARVDPSLKI